MEEYLCQSLLYLRDTQATLQKAALRFIGEPQPPRDPLLAAWPQSPPLRWQQGAALWEAVGYLQQ